MAEGAKKKPIIGIIICLLILVIAGGLVCVWAFVNPGSTSKVAAIEKYFKAISEEDENLYKKTCYTKKWSDNYNPNGTGKNINDEIKETFSMQSGATYSDVTLISQEKIEQDRVDQLINSIEKVHGIEVKISKVYSVSFKMNITFDGTTSDTGTITRYCYKSGGKWYFLADPDVMIDADFE